MVKRLKNPKKTKDEVLTTLEKCGLKKSIEKFKTTTNNQWCNKIVMINWLLQLFFIQIR
jgi:hypothetical protein